MGKSTILGKVVSLAILAALVIALPVLASGAQKAAMADRYLIVSPHTAEQCLAALDDIEANSPKLLSMIDWGCMAGDHTGYAVVTAASEEEARNMLPAGARAGAKVVKLNKFTAEQIKSFHQKSK